MAQQQPSINHPYFPRKDLVSDGFTHPLAVASRRKALAIDRPNLVEVRAGTGDDGGDRVRNNNSNNNKNHSSSIITVILL